MARQTGKISDKLGLSPKNPVFRSKNWVYQVINWVYREKLSFSSDQLGLSINYFFNFEKLGFSIDKPSLSINWVYQLKN